MRIRLGLDAIPYITPTMKQAPAEFVRLVADLGAGPVSPLSSGSILALSWDGSTPAKLAALLAERGLGASRLTVLESLGGPNERVLPGLGDFLAKGGRKIDAWYGALNAVEVAFDDQADAFSNINTEEELRAHQRR